MKLVILTKSTYFVEEDKILTTLFEEGLDNLHILKADPSPLYLERLLLLVPKQYHRYITLHQHFDFIHRFSLAGIHLDSVDAQLPKRYKGSVGRSCGDIMQLEMVKRQADYVFLHRFHESADKNNHEAVVSELELNEASRLGMFNRNVYAMGGVKYEDIDHLKSLGFGGVVIGSELWKRFDITSDLDFKNIIAYFRRLKKAVE